MKMQPCAGPHLRAWWMVGAAGRVSHPVAPPNSGQEAPGQINGQAIAQNHQDPLNFGERRALELLPQAGSLYRQYWGLKDSRRLDYHARL